MERWPWGDKELAAVVQAYLHMAYMERKGLLYSKRKIYRDFSMKFGERSIKAFEYRMQNISAVLMEMGLPWVPGLPPARNVGPNVRSRIAALLAASPPVAAERTKPAPEYEAKLPAIRRWLIQVAKMRGTVTYGDVMKSFGIGFRNILRAMGHLGHQSMERKEPIITALIVSAKTGRCSTGFAAGFGIADDIVERERLYRYWQKTEPEPDQEPLVDADQPLEIRAARFASVEVRPQQAAFRRDVYMAYEGRCAISNCNVGAALDAAHKHGREWRKGNNTGADGYLLRKDLHALYDNHLLRITDSGVVELEPSVGEHYHTFAGVVINAKHRGAGGAR
ncbi:HNH endonuclease signature motif containing protein [Ralstonia sp. UBA689]|uniref:HNH endonuclease signature motif containing protein n=1 Tax=Ralstonia sp. UBA689 TaxID=1947373 RepID=UPI0025FBA75C|nr:HNH endonuclease signature motif containing protein [Ralstonia sp. UBA689]